MLKDFINIINSKIGCGYAWGGNFGTLLTKEKLQQLVNRFGREHYYFNSYSTEKWIGKEAGDCSDLILFGLKKDNKLNPNQDYTAEGIYINLCRPITKAELKAGDLVFTKTASGIVHVGVYMGANRVTHARGTFYGVVNTQLFDSFNMFGRLTFFENEQEIINPALEESIDILYNSKPAVLTDKQKWLEKANKDKDIYWLITKMARKMKGV